MRGLDLPVADLPIVIIPGGPLLRNPGGRALLDALGMAGAEGPYPAGACDLLVVGGGRAAGRQRPVPAAAPPHAARAGTVLSTGQLNTRSRPVPSQP